MVIQESVFSQIYNLKWGICKKRSAFYSLLSFLSLGNESLFSSLRSHRFSSLSLSSFLSLTHSLSPLLCSSVAVEWERRWRLRRRLSGDGYRRRQGGDGGSERGIAVAHWWRWLKEDIRVFIRSTCFIVARVGAFVNLGL